MKSVWKIVFVAVELHRDFDPVHTILSSQLCPFVLISYWQQPIPFFAVAFYFCEMCAFLYGKTHEHRCVSYSRLSFHSFIHFFFSNIANIHSNLSLWFAFRPITTHRFRVCLCHCVSSTENEWSVLNVLEMWTIDLVGLFYMCLPFFSVSCTHLSDALFLLCFLLIPLKSFVSNV